MNNEQSEQNDLRRLLNATLPGHLLKGNFISPRWLTGGSDGPEGSVLLTCLLVLFWLFISAWLGEKRYPSQHVLES